MKIKEFLESKIEVKRDTDKVEVQVSTPDEVGCGGLVFAGSCGKRQNPVIKEEDK